MKKVKSEKVKRSKKLYKPKEDISLYSHENDDSCFYGFFKNMLFICSAFRILEIKKSSTSTCMSQSFYIISHACFFKHAHSKHDAFLSQMRCQNTNLMH